MSNRGNTAGLSAWQKLLQGTIVAAAALTMTGCEPTELYPPTPTPGPTPIVSPSPTPLPPAPTAVPTLVPPTPTPYVPPTPIAPTPYVPPTPVPTAVPSPTPTRTNTGYSELPIDQSLLGKTLYYPGNPPGSFPWITASDRILVGRIAFPVPNCPTYFDELYVNVGAPPTADESVSIKGDRKSVV
jgi:hypothetical protein